MYAENDMRLFWSVTSIILKKLKITRESLDNLIVNVIHYFVCFSICLSRTSQYTGLWECGCDYFVKKKELGYGEYLKLFD